MVASDRSFWTIVAHGSTPSVQRPFFTFPATGLVDLSLHALTPESAKLARRNTAIGLISVGLVFASCVVHSTASG